MSLQQYCCPDLGTKATICGSDKLKGGIKHVFIILQNQITITDWTSTSQWNAAIANGDVILIQDVKGEYPEPTEVEVDSLIGCGNDTELDGFNHQLNWMDRAVTAGNDTFYESLNTCQRNFGWFDCQSNGVDKIRVVENSNVSFVCKPAINEASVNTTQRYICAAKWNSEADDFPALYDAPSGIFL